MRGIHAKLLLAGMGLTLSTLAFGQALPIIPALPQARAKVGGATPVAKHKHQVRITADSAVHESVPGALQARSHQAGAGISVALQPGITAHAGLQALRWAPLNCGAPTAATSGACLAVPQEGAQRGEVGAAFARPGMQLDLSVGHSQSSTSALARPGVLPRVLPAAGGADVAAPLWFRNSSASDISARGELNVAPGTSLNLGASVGRVRFLPGSGAASGDTLDQTTVSLGIQHDAVRGAIVGHVLEPNLPGAALDQNQRWSGIDLGISVRLPWRGELNFGAQNVWTSGRSPLLFGPGASAPDQGRVPYVQYHQDL